MTPTKVRPTLCLLGIMLLFGFVSPIWAVLPTPTPTPTAGYLRARIDSLGGDALAAGAQWRRTGTTAWRNPDAMETMVPLGTYTVEFKSVQGYIPPINQTAVIAPARLTTVEGTYSLLPCSIIVTINPPGAVAAGALWKREGTVPWIASGTFENGLNLGSYYIVFKTIDGWLAPAKIPCTLTAGKQVLINATYQQLGSLKVTIAPPEAAAEGAKWRRAGTAAWLDSDATEKNILPGDYQVEFKDTPLWVTPASQAVTVTAGLTASATGVYTSLDTQMAWSTYAGGTSTEYAQAVAIDTTGTIYICGTTLSAGWAAGGLDTVLNDGDASPGDAFAVKISSTGQHVWSTYLGGAGNEYGNGIALDGAGDIAVTGITYSPGWVSGGYNTNYGGNGDAFVVKLSPGGAHLWSTYLGGANIENGFGIAATAAGEFCVVGDTNSRGWVSGGFDVGLGTETSYAPETAYASTDGFAVKLDGAGAHVWSTYLGNESFDQARSVAADSLGNVYVAGVTDSSDWILRGFDTSYNGHYDGFLVKLSPICEYAWGTYIGGMGNDYANGVATDSGGNICVVGSTLSSGWMFDGFDLQYKGGSDIFAAKFLPDGRQPWCTYMGGDQDDEAAAVAFDRGGDILLTGRTTSAGWVSGDLNNTFNQSGTTLLEDAFVAKLSAAGAPAWSTYLGGPDQDHGRGIAINTHGMMAVTGYSRSPGWVAGGYDLILDGDYDGFVAVIYKRIANP